MAVEDWTVDLDNHRATKGNVHFGFYDLVEGGFSLSFGGGYDHLEPDEQAALKVEAVEAIAKAKTQ